MSGFAHKAEDAMHFHRHDQNKPADHERDVSQPHAPTVDKGSHGHQHHHEGQHLSQEERDRANFDAARHFDHATKNSHGAGIGFEE
ncbi:hypothetical protein N7478_005877 [Penicillium angulare]|uniref:uncharacterized protein n=1 Tax=Penicillium angulare TaxID=116970 RepID=UPI002540CB6E|nr:uncharacterized protein N7478_005877 [Penicillium angulare]KAJ5280505.1 hypothetical protein N7478_005877 [Penicillium angulare]